MHFLLFNILSKNEKGKHQAFVKLVSQHNVIPEGIAMFFPGSALYCLGSAHVML